MTRDAEFGFVAYKKAYKGLALSNSALQSIRALVPGIGNNRIERANYFAQRFWFARDYSADVGGETVRLAIEAAEQFEQLLNRPSVGSVTLETRTRHLTNVLSIKAKLQQISCGHPVVYAVRIERYWFENLHDPRIEGGFCFADNNMRCYRPIPSDNILARADYVGGVEPGYENLSHLAHTWEEAIALQ